MRIFNKGGILPIKQSSNWRLGRILTMGGILPEDHLAPWLSGEGRVGEKSFVCRGHALVCSVQRGESIQSGLPPVPPGYSYVCVHTQLEQAGQGRVSPGKGTLEH